MKREAREIQELETNIESTGPERGSKPVDIKEFDKLPISSYTKSALKMANFINMTDIQQCSIPHALVGRDILGAAKTGSGKTLGITLSL